MHDSRTVSPRRCSRIYALTPNAQPCCVRPPRSHVKGHQHAPPPPHQRTPGPVHHPTDPPGPLVRQSKRQARPTPARRADRRRERAASQFRPAEAACHILQALGLEPLARLTGIDTQIIPQAGATTLKNAQGAAKLPRPLRPRPVKSVRAAASRAPGAQSPSDANPHSPRATRQCEPAQTALRPTDLPPDDPTTQN